MQLHVMMTIVREKLSRERCVYIKRNCEQISCDKKIIKF